ncbi:MAG: lamin tail domain-containing protein, partial [Flavobacteriales bacterium]
SADFCAGGTIASNTNNSYVSFCIGSDPQVIAFSSAAMGNGDGYLYAVTDGDGVIVSILDSASIDLSTLGQAGDYFIWGVNYYTPLDTTTAEVGDTLAQIESVNSCASVSDNTIQIHISACTPIEGCTRLFFSQYLEGTSNNKALEIFNPTPFPVNMSGYAVYAYANGAAAFTSVVPLSGTLQPGDVYVIANSQADQAILDQADITAGLATFNGNDALVLKFNGDSIDVIGVIGNDPGSAGWQFGDLGLVDHNLVRHADVTSPTTDWGLSQGQWTGINISDFSGIGSHTAQACSNEAYVTFEIASELVSEDVGSVTVLVQGYNVLQDVPITVQLQSETTTQGSDWNGTIPADFTLSPGNTTFSFTIDVVDDAIEETTFEYLTLQLLDVNDVATFVNETYTLTIEPSDFTFPLYPIATVTSAQNTIADSIGVICSVAGIVHGINFNPNGVEFTLIDPTDGIKVFDADENFGYTVQEGDSVVVSGVIDQFMGMVEIYPIAIEFISSGNPLENPTTLSSLSEENESHIVRLVCYELVDPAQWTSAGSGFDVDITNGTDTAVMHIDLNTDIFGQAAPAGHFTVVGIGGQRDETDPYDSHYEFWPRAMSDYSDEVIAAFLAPSDIVFNDNGATVPFVNQSAGASEYTWDFGDGSSSFIQSPSHDYAYNYLAGVTDVVVGLSVTSPLGCEDETESIIPVIYSWIDEQDQSLIQIYPNPAVEYFTVQSEEVVLRVRVLNLDGQLVESIVPNRTQVTCNTIRWATGTYIVEIMTPTRTIRERVSIR